jgi:pimeloyl-ACP methyl ester carboxylesterase
MKTSTPTPTSTSTLISPSIEKVKFTTMDGLLLGGTLFGDGGAAVILAHQGTTGADQTTWHDFAQLLAESGFSALTFDFRGIGQSEGEIIYEKVGIDVNAAVKFLRDRGFDHIICVGASMGGTACIQAALDNDLFGLVVFASTMRAGARSDGLSIEMDDLQALTLPKLFITAEEDGFLVVDHTKRMFEASPEPKELILLPGSEHGTYLFATEVGDELTADLLAFLESIPSSTSTPEPISLPIFESSQCMFEYNSPNRVECGYLVVPENRSKPDSPPIRIHVAIFKSTSATPKPDPVIYVAGGGGFNQLASSDPET